MLEDTLRALNDAVVALDTPKCLSILNIDEELLDSPGTTLEYVARCRAWTRLRNIAKSIPDLLSQSESVALVGFLGHFSSGKSSLINALLGVSSDENPGYKRDVGLHPTDTRITLITHQDQAKLVRKSPYTAVDGVEVVHGLLWSSSHTRRWLTRRASVTRPRNMRPSRGSCTFAMCW